MYLHQKKGEIEFIESGQDSIQDSVFLALHYILTRMLFQQQKIDYFSLIFFLLLYIKKWVFLTSALRAKDTCQRN